jgi:hypothetical protein
VTKEEMELLEFIKSFGITTKQAFISMFKPVLTRE